MPSTASPASRGSAPPPRSSFPRSVSARQPPQWPSSTPPKTTSKPRLPHIFPATNQRFSQKISVFSAEPGPLNIPSKDAPADPRKPPPAHASSSHSKPQPPPPKTPLSPPHPSPPPP